MDGDQDEAVMREQILVVDIRSEDGNEILIEFSDGRIVRLTVQEILQAVESVADDSRSLPN